MRLTARKFIISLLILVQGLVLWQGAFAAGLIQLSVTTTENLLNYQTSIHDHTPLSSILEKKESLNCCEESCELFCHCHDCDDCQDGTCSSLGLIATELAISFLNQVLNCTAFPTYLNGLSVQLLKPPANSAVEKSV